MDSVEDYVRQLTKRENENVDIFSEWMKSVNSFMQYKIKKLNVSMSTRATSINKALRDIVFVC